ncbi:MAG: hypothetical protein WAQ52_13720 [Terriglobales bacterium]
MSTNAAPIADPSLPPFPCPGCGNNLLTEGFHNSCTETTRLREDNYPVVLSGTLFLEHNEDNHETIRHVCDVEAYCTSCNQLLPWTLYEIRGLNGVNVSEADTVIANLLAKLPESGQEDTA